MKRSPWFNARTQPPVNGGDDAVYETRCEKRFAPPFTTVAYIRRRGERCEFCQWRGLLRKEGEK